MSRALLLPGWGTPPERLHPMRDAFRRAGVDAHVHDYAPRNHVAWLRDELLETIEEPVHLVGHSLGGIVASSAALEAPDAVRTVTTINAPFRGTWAGYTGDSRLARELRWRAPTLRRLRDDLAAHLAEAHGPRWLLLSTAGDLAAPATTSLRVGAQGPRLARRVLAANGHSLSLMRDQVVRAVVEHAATDVGASS